MTVSVWKTTLPDELSPTTTLQVALPSGRLINLPCCRPTFFWSQIVPIQFPFWSYLSDREYPKAFHTISNTGLSTCGKSGVSLSIMHSGRAITSSLKETPFHSQYPALA